MESFGTWAGFLGYQYNGLNEEGFYISLNIHLINIFKPYFFSNCSQHIHHTSDLMLVSGKSCQDYKGIRNMKLAAYRLMFTIRSVLVIPLLLTGFCVGLYNTGIN